MLVKSQNQVKKHGFKSYHREDFSGSVQRPIHPVLSYRQLHRPDEN